MPTFVLSSAILVLSLLVANVTAPGRSKRLLSTDDNGHMKVPHQVSLQLCKRGDDGNTSVDACRDTSRHLCGGFILNKRSVVSAALCFLYMTKFEDMFEFYAVVGTETLYSKEGSFHKVVDTKTHPDKDEEIKLREYGVAVFTVSPEFTWSDSVKPAPAMHMNPYQNQHCIVSGFGCQEKIRPPEIVCDLQHQLQVRHVSLHTNVLCDAELRPRGYVSAQHYFLCFHMHTVCNGDLGDPLTCNGGVIGLAVTHYNTCREEYTDVYINIGKHKVYLNESTLAYPAPVSTVLIIIALTLMLR